jgi:hypothetical protein
MSQSGIKKAADLLSMLQQTRIALAGGDNQDMLLAQILHRGHEAMKADFAKVVMLNAEGRPGKQAKGVKRRKGRKNDV